MGDLTPTNLLEKLAEFTVSLKFEDLSKDLVHETKRRIFDTVGCAFAGMHDDAVKIVRKALAERGTRLANALALGMEGSYTLGDAAYLNTHAIRVLDANDTYLSLEPAHPSDNIGALLALVGPSKPMFECGGKELILSTVLAYELQCRFCDFASLREGGWDHTAYLAMSSAIGAGKILCLTKNELLHAISLAAYAPLRQARAGSQLSMAKALNAAEAVRKGAESAWLAKYGTTGPSEILEGEFGFIKQCLINERLGMGSGKLDIEAFGNFGLEFRLPKTHIKYFPVEYHAQSAVWASLHLRKTMGVDGKLPIEGVERIRLFVPEATKTIIGGLSKRRPGTKEAADHSIFYIIAAALLDGEMTLKQFELQRFSSPDILKLIDLMEVEESPIRTYKYHNKNHPEFSTMIILTMKNGDAYAPNEFPTPRGHFANPMTDKELEEKALLPKNITDLVWNLENISAKDLYWTLKGMKT